MRNTELVPAKASLQVVTQNRAKRIDIKIWDIPLRLMGILLAGAMPVSGLAPFGISFLTIDRRFSLKSIINLLCVSAGYLLLFDFWMAVRYISSCVLFEAVLFVLERNEKPSLYFVAAAAGIIMFICETAVLIFQGFTVAGLVLILCDVLLMMTGTLVFDRSRDVLLENKFLSRGLLTDEKISICVMAGVLLISARAITIMNIFNISGFLACVMLGVTALTGKGVTHTAIAGIYAGIVLGIGGYFPEYVAVFTLLGLVAGGSVQLGKNALCLSMAVFAFGIMLYLGIPIGKSHLPNIYELLSAAAVIYVMPKKAVMAAERVISFETEDSDEADRFRKYVNEKLMRISASFTEIYRAFDNIPQSSEGDMAEISLLFDTAADRVCRSCEKIGYCWKADFNATYNTMFKLLEIMERRGALQLNDIPKAFADKCIRLLPFTGELNRLFEVYKINNTWKNKIRENRELTAEQFRGIAEIIKNAAEEICDERTFDIEAADEIRDVLNDMGIVCERADVICDKNNKYTIELIISGCDDFTVCRKRIKSVIKRVMGINVAVPYSLCENKRNGKCSIRFCQLEELEPIIGISQISCDGESGDRHRTDYLGSGKLAVTISDGMGTGHTAAMESGSIVSLLGSFLDAGFDKAIAVKLINSVMVMKSARDAFATVDMCVIDLYTGQVEFIKNGAEPSFIKTREYTETVRAASLPIGIVPISDIESFARTLGSDSVVVMTSDGISAAPDDPWIRELIEDADPNIEPKQLSQLILDEAMARNAKNNTRNDDMTVVCIKLKSTAA